MVEHSKVLAREAWCKLPGYLQVVARELEVKKIWFPPEGTKLPAATPSIDHNYHSDEKEYLAYVQEQLNNGARDPGALKSFMTGLRMCGKEGEQLIEEIKKKVLRR